MSERPFHCIPGELWLDDEVLDSVSDDAESLFRKFADASDRDWRIRVSSDKDPMAHAHSLRARLFRGMTKNQRWPRARIDSALRELRASGLLQFQVHDQHGERHWFELAPRLQYTKGEDRGKPPAPPVQGELLQGGLALLPKEDKETRGQGEGERKASPRTHGRLLPSRSGPDGRSDRIAVRGEKSKKRTDPDSRLRQGASAGLACAASPAVDEGENRVGDGEVIRNQSGTSDQSGIPSAKPPSELMTPSSLMTDYSPESPHARTIVALQASKLGQRLCRFLGPGKTMTEARASGAEWLRILREESDVLECLLEQGERIRDSELKTGDARARFLMRRLKDRRAA